MPNTPNIHLFVVELTLDDFRWDVVKGAAEGLSLTMVTFKITKAVSRQPSRSRTTSALRSYLEGSSWLDVSMDDGLAMQVLETGDDLP